MFNIIIIKFFLGLHVAKILTQVHVTKREAQIKLDETDFDERRLINKRKKLINEGKDPDEIKKKIKSKRKEKEQKRLKRKNKIYKDNNINGQQDIDVSHREHFEKCE